MKKLLLVVALSIISSFIFSEENYEVHQMGEKLWLISINYSSINYNQAFTKLLAKGVETAKQNHYKWIQIVENCSHDGFISILFVFYNEGPSLKSKSRLIDKE